jgi:hypothetical protein
MPRPTHMRLCPHIHSRQKSLRPHTRLCRPCPHSPTRIRPSQLRSPSSCHPAGPRPISHKRPLRPCPTIHLRLVTQQRGDPGGSRREQGKSHLPWTVSQRPFDPYGRAWRSYGRGGSAGVGTDNPGMECSRPSQKFGSSFLCMTPVQLSGSLM